jgi:sugar phosphate permease
MNLKKIHYSWVMVAMTVAILIVHALISYCFGLFLKPMTLEFGWDRGALAAVYSMIVLVTGSLGILSGRLTDRYGPRPIVTSGGLLIGIAFILMSQINSLWQVYLIWGFLVGVGFSFCLIPVMTIIPRWFVKGRGMVMGIAMAGRGVGGIISPLLAQWLISDYGWRWTFFILGLIAMVFITSIAQFMRHSPQRMGIKPLGGDEIVEVEQSRSTAAEGLSFSQAIRTSRFWLFGFILASVFFCLGTIMVHIVPYANDTGIPAITAASVLSIAAGISIIGRLIIGYISDRIGGRLILTICLILITLSIIWLLFAEKTWMFYMFAVMFGLSYGGFTLLLPVVTAELFGLASLGIIIGAITFMTTLGDAVGAPVSGTMFDTTGSYQLAFLTIIGICTVAVILSVFLLRYQGKTDSVRG